MIGLVGGTGPEGRGLALRFALAGEPVTIGSREESRAAEAARGVAAATRAGSVTGATNAETAQRADIVFVTVPYPAQRTTLSALEDHLAGKLVVVTVSPLAFRKGIARTVEVEEGSAALEAQATLPGSDVVAAFQTISAHDLLEPDAVVDSDVVVCADNAAARHRVMELALTISGVRAVDGGGLQNSRYVEGLTALLLNINRTYKARSAIKIAGI